jgi:hypothetical protein
MLLSAGGSDITSSELVASDSDTDDRIGRRRELVKGDVVVFSLRL